jgi:hypothetical protein
MRPHRSQELLELIDRETRIAHDARHGLRIDGIGSRDGQDSNTVGHDDVLALAGDAKASLLQCADRQKVRHARQLRHG